MLRLRSRRLVVWGVVLITTVVGVVFVHDYLWCFWEDPGIETVSGSVAESKSRRIWITSLQAIPNEVSAAGETVHIDSAWLEYSSQKSERWLTPAEQRLGGVNICFTISGNAPDSDCFFSPNDDGWSVTECGSQTETVYTVDLKDASDVKDLRLSFLSSFDEPRPKDIRFVPQP